MKKLLILLLISNLIYSRGEISFSKQQKNKEDKVISETENITKNYSSKIINISTKELQIREEIVNSAKTQLGKPYLWGAIGTNSFDCSSFVQYVYKQSTGINLPRVSYQQAEFRPKKNNGLKKGDLLFFETLRKGRISHVGIYIGNNKVVHAGSTATGIHTSTANYRSVNCVRRIVK